MLGGRSPVGPWCNSTQTASYSSPGTLQPLSLHLQPPRGPLLNDSLSPRLTVHSLHRVSTARLILGHSDLVLFIPVHLPPPSEGTSLPATGCSLAHSHRFASDATQTAHPVSGLLPPHKKMPSVRMVLKNSFS